jgi:transcription-repair coupling factor (superfamily II helicase)
MHYSSLPKRSDIIDDLKESVYSAPKILQLHKGIKSVDTLQTDLVRVSGSLQAFIASSIVDKLDNKLLYISPDIRSAEKSRDDLRSLLGDDRVFLLPAQFSIPYDPLHQNHRFDERAAVFERLLDGMFDVIIAIPPSMVERHHALRIQKKRMIKFTVGDEIDRDVLALVLTEAGMRREIRAEEPGDFAVRGSVIDVYPPSAETPIRIELWGDEISEIRQFDPVTQRSMELSDSITFYAGEKGKEEARYGLWDLLPRKTILYVDDHDALLQGLDKQWEEIDYQYEKRKELELDHRTLLPDELYIRPEEIDQKISGLKRVIYRGVAASSEGAINFNSRSHESYLGDLDRLGNNLKQFKMQRAKSFVLCDREPQVDRLSDLLADHGGADEAARIGVLPLHQGFSLSDDGINVLTDHEIFGRHKRTSPFRKRKHQLDPTAFEELKNGDLVVHTDFGIGRYLGPKRITVKGVERDCLQIEYRDDVKVYVRLDHFNKLQKYQGAEDGEPKLSKIGGTDWSKNRVKTKKAVEKLAKEILQIYARRQIEGGFAFRPDSPWQREMEAAFEFDDTPDQTTSSEQTKRDMEKPVAMDRLLVGDVGFGKTEVAVRAAFKAVQESKQVAILVPTTILAQQHFITFVERLRRYPIKIEVLSRFVPKKVQNDIVERLEKGDVDLLIGTHRLLSKDIKFKDLGLLVIDEEHRFGVKQKESIRKFRASVDILSMSATPIPRTLHMALAGARDMSMISTPPEDRLPIETEIVPFDERLIREAILRETARGGQVYFLHNRVETIYAMKRTLKDLLPDINFGVAHGQMKEGELSTAMDDFLHEKHQVLICTMIIESGLDIPNVNTLLVNRADRFGVAQLYQLRGRIGRSHRQAYAYLLTPPRMLLRTDAKRRLETIAENTRLGSGFQIAMRDLEIRGAGNLLGAEQSGYINSVGFEMYTEMLSKAVQDLNSESITQLPETTQKKRDSRDVKVEVQVDAFLPTEYIPDASERVEVYRKLSKTQTQNELVALREEIVDRYGVMPSKAINLFEIVETQTLGAQAGVAKIEIHSDAVFFNFVDDWGSDKFDIQMAELLTAVHEFPIELLGSGTLGLKLNLNPNLEWKDRWERVRDLLTVLPED